MKNTKKYKNTFKLLAVAAALSVALTGCASSSDSQYTDHDNAPAKLALSADVGYVNLSSLPVSTANISPIRLQAIRETATQLGATGGLAWRALQIDNSLSGQAGYLDHVFDFNQLLLPHNVLPPVLTEADDSINQDNGTALRLASKTYQLISNARFVTSPPTWRTYLWMHYDKPDMPDHTLLPSTQAEAKLWNIYLKQGWKEGLNQANSIFGINLNRLKRDYKGMVLYRKLYAENMVSAPFVASTDLGVTGDANHIRINDRVLRITALSKMQTNSNDWNPVLIK
jgi:defect-in-organelle-trafficking protein DotC